METQKAKSTILDEAPTAGLPNDDDVVFPPLCPHCGRKTSSDDAGHSAILLLTQKMTDMETSVNRAIMALTRKVGATNQKIEKMQEEADQLSNKTIHTVNQLAKRVADDIERNTKMSDRVDNRVLCVKASHEQLRNNIELLKDSQAANTDEWVDKINSMEDRLNTICDELQEYVNVLYEKINAPSRPTAVNTPYVASTSSPMDVRNHSSPTPQIHRDTR